jgi:MFS family permease
MSRIGDRARTTWRVIAAVLHNPALRRLQAAFLAFNSVEYGAWVAILLYADEATGPASVGVVALAQLVPAAMIAPLSATLGDRYARERVLAVGYLVLAALLGLTATGMLVGADPLLVYAAAIAGSMSLTIVRPTQNALLPALSRTAEELTAANAATSITEAGGILLGPLLAAAVLLVAGPGAVLAVLAVVTLVAATLVLLLRIGTPTEHGTARVSVLPPHGGSVATPVDPGAPGDVPAGARDGPRAEVLAGFRALAAAGDARLVVGILAARSLMVGVTDVLFVLLAIELFETGESGAAILSAAIGLGGVIGGGGAFLLVGQPRIAPILAASALVWGATFALIGLLASGGLAPLLLVVGGTGLAIMDVAGRTILQRAVRDAVLARVFGILEGLIMAALAVGSIVVPVVVAGVGLQASVLVFAAILPITLALAWPALRAIDRRAIVPARSISLLRTLSLFEALDPPVMEALARSATWLTVPAGAVVIREGELGDRFYVLESGAMRVTRDGRHLRDMERTGEGFGEIALLRDVPRTATVTAAVESSLLVLDRPSFLWAVTGDASVAAEAARIADARIADQPA